MQPTAYVLAGPNGVGKSTAAYQLIPVGVEYINPDDIARQLRQHQNRQEVVLQATNDEAGRRMANHLLRRESFGVETNLYDHGTWQYFLALQQRGYFLNILFLCTSHQEILLERVQNRYQQGGHFVRADVIRERYLNGLFWLNHFFDRPNAITLFDVSNGLTPVYRRSEGIVDYQANPLPGWVGQHLGAHFDFGNKEPTPSARSADSLDQVRAIYRQLESKPPTD